MHQPVFVNGTEMLLIKFILDYTAYHFDDDIETYQLDDVTG